MTFLNNHTEKHQAAKCAQKGMVGMKEKPTKRVMTHSSVSVLSYVVYYHSSILVLPSLLSKECIWMIDAGHCVNVPTTT